ncbi:MAG: MscL family protein [Actinomycetota bacterium]
MEVMKTVTEPFKGFKAFVTKSSSVDLAIGVVIGAAFTAVVNKLVTNVLNPIISLPGKLNYDGLSVCLKHIPGPPTRCGIALGYGAVITAFVTFLLTAAAVYFVFVRPLTRLREGKKGRPASRACPECLSEIPVEATRCRACGVAILVP